MPGLGVGGSGDIEVWGVGFGGWVLGLRELEMGFLDWARS